MSLTEQTIGPSRASAVSGAEQAQPSGSGGQAQVHFVERHRAERQLHRQRHAGADFAAERKAGEARPDEPEVEDDFELLVAEQLLHEAVPFARR